MIAIIVALITWHALCSIVLSVLGRLIERPNRKGLAYALALVNVGYVLAYLTILFDLGG